MPHSTLALLVALTLVRAHSVRSMHLDRKSATQHYKLATTAFVRRIIMRTTTLSFTLSPCCCSRGSSVPCVVPLLLFWHPAATRVPVQQRATLVWQRRLYVHRAAVSYHRKQYHCTSVSVSEGAGLGLCLCEVLFVSGRKRCAQC